MKEIKTVVCPIYEAGLFDEKVNSLIADKWNLKKRTIISVKGEPNEAGSYPIIQSLYAEFERERDFPEEITV